VKDNGIGQKDQILIWIGLVFTYFWYPHRYSLACGSLLVGNENTWVNSWPASLQGKWSTDGLFSRVRGHRQDEIMVLPLFPLLCSGASKFFAPSSSSPPRAPLLREMASNPLPYPAPPHTCSSRQSDDHPFGRLRLAVVGSSETGGVGPSDTTPEADLAHSYTCAAPWGLRRRRQVVVLTRR
jgi:hypothetical protein